MGVKIAVSLASIKLFQRKEGTCAHVRPWAVLWNMIEAAFYFSKDNEREWDDNEKAVVL